MEDNMNESVIEMTYGEYQNIVRGRENNMLLADLDDFVFEMIDLGEEYKDLRCYEMRKYLCCKREITRRLNEASKND